MHRPEPEPSGGLRGAKTARPRTALRAAGGAGGRCGTGAAGAARGFRARDAASLFCLVTPEEVSRFISPPPGTVVGFEKFIAWTLRQRSAGSYACFAVTLDATDTAIGIFQLRQLEPGFGTAASGFETGSSYWGPG